MSKSADDKAARFAEARDVADDRPRVLSLGGGVNSTALLSAMARKNIPPDLVLFADTGGERPETYKHVEHIWWWCDQREIEFRIVTNGGRGQGRSLEENCLMRKELPSLAYGFKGCSVKWKRQPMDRFVRDWRPAIDCWATGGKVIRYIGIDAGEAHRAVLTEDEKFIYRYPLVEWGMGRQECIDEIKSRGWLVPPKSSCYYCPAMRRNEILDLQRDHPELLERALKIEANAETHTVSGLGRNWKWADFIKQENAQGKLWPECDAPCDCMDESDV